MAAGREFSFANLGLSESLDLGKIHMMNLVRSDLPDKGLPMIWRVQVTDVYYLSIGCEEFFQAM